jgi:DNA-binding cell septation regulator SpoVG
MTQKERQLKREWQEFLEDIKNATPVDKKMSAAEIEKHRIYLEAHPVEWILFFFLKYAKYPFADFHIKFIKRIIAHPEWYEVISWSRELAKSTVIMFVLMYLTLTGKKKNVLLISNSLDNSKRLLAPYRGNLEANGRIKQYYGEQMNPGNWTDTEFITKQGAAFRALGAGQSPRGSRNEEIRPDVEYYDDFDTDGECRNPDIINKKWEWSEKSVYPTRSISEPTLILWGGNIIAKDCCIIRAGAMADHWDIVNIRDKNGKSTWPEKNTEEMIDRTLSKITMKSQQGEYYNNPISEGEIFKEMTYGKVPALSKFKFLVIYGDPTPGENKTKKSSTKSVCLLGKLNGKLYIIKCFLDRGLNSEFIDWYVQLLNFVAGKTTVYCWMENNKLQDPFFQQVFQPIVRKVRKEKNISLYIKGDTEKKTDKASRIDANLEPMNREGNLILNEAEKDNPHMKRLEEQFKLFTLRLDYPADGPDTVEGGNRMIDKKLRDGEPERIIPRSALRSNNKNRL